MGEEEFDLDGELGLDGDDDFGGGDDGDFAGSIDSEMDDDGLDDSGGGETELDSFFEDLSSIDDMDSAEPEPAPAAAAPAAEPAAAPAAAPAPAAESAPSKGGKMKWIIMLVVLLGLGGAAYWYLSSPPPEEVMMEAPALEEVAMPAEEPIQVEMEPAAPPPPVRRAAPKPVPVAPPPPPPVVKTVVVGPQYLVQVGSCSFEKCKRDYADRLRRMGFPVYYRTTGEKYDFIELITRDVFTMSDGQEWVKMLNDANQRAGVASLAPQSNGFRVTLGNFTSLDKAKDLKIYLEGLFPKKGLRLNLEHVRKNYETIKVFAGPFNSKRRARQVQKKFRGEREFTGAFVVRY